MKAIAACNEITSDGVSLPIFFIRDAGMVGIEIVDGHIIGFVNGGQPRRLACVHQISGDFGLAINHDLLAAGQIFQIDAMTLAFEQQVKPSMNQALFLQSLVYASLSQHIQSDLL